MIKNNLKLKKKKLLSDSFFKLVNSKNEDIYKKLNQKIYAKFLFLNGYIIRYFATKEDFYILNAVLIKDLIKKTFRKIRINPFSIEEDNDTTSLLGNYMGNYYFRYHLYQFLIFKTFKVIENNKAIEMFLTAKSFNNFKVLLFMLSSYNCSKVCCVTKSSAYYEWVVCVNLGKTKNYKINFTYTDKGTLWVDVWKIYLKGNKDNKIIIDKKKLLNHFVNFKVWSKKDFSTALLNSYKDTFYTMLNEKILNIDTHSLAVLLSLEC